MGNLKTKPQFSQFRNSLKTQKKRINGIKTVPLLGFFPEKMKSALIKQCPCTYYSAVGNSSDVQSRQLSITLESIYTGTVKEKMLWLQMWLSLKIKHDGKKACLEAVWGNLGAQSTKRNKPSTEGQTPSDLTDIQTLKMFNSGLGKWFHG